MYRVFLLQITDFDIWHRIAPLQVLCLITLTFIFNVKHFLLGICNKNCAETMGVPGRFASTCTAPAVELLSFCRPNGENVRK